MKIESYILSNLTKNTRKYLVDYMDNETHLWTVKDENMSLNRVKIFKTVNEALVMSGNLASKGYGEWDVIKVK